MNLVVYNRISFDFLQIWSQTAQIRRVAENCPIWIAGMRCVEFNWFFKLTNEMEKLIENYKSNLWSLIFPHFLNCVQTIFDHKKLPSSSWKSFYVYVFHSSSLFYFSQWWDEVMDIFNVVRISHLYRIKHVYALPLSF